MRNPPQSLFNINGAFRSRVCENKPRLLACSPLHDTSLFFIDELHACHVTWFDLMKYTELKLWLDCDDEMKMHSFIENFTDDTALRNFAVLNAKSVEALLIDHRSRNALIVAEAYLNDAVTAQELEHAYYEAESALIEIEEAHISENDPTQSEENIENAALVALWVAYPVNHTGSTSLESARESALHTAFYCFQIYGTRALREQVERFKLL